MKIKIFNTFRYVFFIFCILNTSYVFAQAGQNQGGVSENLKMDTFTIVGTTAAGVVLGASTLSFAEEPADHLKNIIVGGALGIIVGVGIVAYKTANQSKEMYIQNSYIQNEPEFRTVDRLIWHRKFFDSNRHKKIATPIALSKTFSF